MSLTKAGYGSQLRKLLFPDVTPDAKFSPQQAMLAFCQARDEYVKLSVLRDSGETHLVPSIWLSVFEDVEPEQDAKGRWVCKLPAKPISLHRDRGVYHVWRSGCEDELFIPVRPSFTSWFASSAAKELEGEQAYYIQNNKIVFLDELSLDTKISFRMLAQSADLPDRAYFPIDDSCLPMILARTLELYSVQKQIPTDTSNDGISN